jgi:hypothetical protein
MNVIRLIDGGHDILEACRMNYVAAHEAAIALATVARKLEKACECTECQVTTLTRDGFNHRQLADIVRFNVKWSTSYGRGGGVAPVDFDVGDPCDCVACWIRGRGNTWMGASDEHAVQL